MNLLILRSIPLCRPETLALYRICLAGALFVALTYNSAPAWLPDGFAEGAAIPPFSQSRVIRDLVESELGTKAVYYGMLGSLVLFGLGLATRLAYGIFVAAFCLQILLIGHGHFVTPLLLGLLAGLGTPWGDAWSLDRAVRAKPLPRRSRRYGFPLWVLGLTICLAYVFAGLSKVWFTDGAWIYYGQARWGFLVDLNLAPTDWGLVFVNSLPLAIVASIWAVLGQVGYIVLPFWRNLRFKLLFGVLVAFPFVFGLILFMGLAWWPWLLLLIFLYVPWEAITRTLLRTLPVLRAVTAPARGARLSSYRDQGAFLCITYLVFAPHIYALALKTEIEPLITSYPMYASDFPDIEAMWERIEGRREQGIYTLVVEDETGREVDLTTWSRWNGMANRAWWGVPRYPLQAAYETAARGEPVPLSTCRTLFAALPGRFEDSPVQRVMISRKLLAIDQETIGWSAEQSPLVIEFRRDGGAAGDDDCEQRHVGQSAGQPPA